MQCHYNCLPPLPRQGCLPASRVEACQAGQEDQQDGRQRSPLPIPGSHPALPQLQPEQIRASSGPRARRPVSCRHASPLPLLLAGLQGLITECSSQVADALLPCVRCLHLKSYIPVFKELRLYCLAAAVKLCSSTCHISRKLSSGWVCPRGSPSVLEMYSFEAERASSCSWAP